MNELDALERFMKRDGISMREAIKKLKKLNKRPTEAHDLFTSHSSYILSAPKESK